MERRGRSRLTSCLEETERSGGIPFLCSARGIRNLELSRSASQQPWSRIFNLAILQSKESFFESRATVLWTRHKSRLPSSSRANWPQIRPLLRFLANISSFESFGAKLWRHSCNLGLMMMMKNLPFHSESLIIFQNLQKSTTSFCISFITAPATAAPASSSS